MCKVASFICIKKFFLNWTFTSSRESVTKWHLHSAPHCFSLLVELYFKKVCPPWWLHAYYSLKINRHFIFWLNDWQISPMNEDSFAEKYERQCVSRNLSWDICMLEEARMYHTNERGQWEVFCNVSVEGTLVKPLTLAWQMPNLATPCYSFYNLDLQNTCQASVDVFKYLSALNIPMFFGGCRISGYFLIWAGKAPIACREATMFMDLWPGNQNLVQPHRSLFDCIH